MIPHVKSVVFSYLIASFLSINASPSVREVNLVDTSELSLASDKINVCAGVVYLLKLIGLNDQNPNPVEHAGSVVGYPDLPRWNFIKPYKNDVLLYGSYPKSETVEIQVITTDQETFESTDRRLHLNVQPCLKPEANYEVEMKFINYNVEDIYEANILSKLETVVQALWNSDDRVYVSKVASVLDVGGRKPIDPRHKEGFVVRFAAEQNFSVELRSLELEVRQLRNRIPCPRNYKRTSVEWRFREIGLVPDWCGFRLFTAPAVEARVTSSEKVQVPVLPAFDGPDLNELPRRTSTKDIFVSLLIPLIICGALLGGIGGTSLCLYSNDDENQK